MPQPSATTGNPSPPLPAVSDFAETQALIHQIAAEARTSGKTLVFDPDATEAEDGTPAAPAKKPAKAAPASEDGEGDTEETTSEQAEAEAPEASPEDQDADEDEPGELDASGEIDVEAVRTALAAEGGVDLIALAKALGKEPEEIGLTPGQAKFLRLEKKKSGDSLLRAQNLAEQLRRDFGSQVEARKAAERGDLDGAIKFIEATFGREWNEINKMVASLLKGQPVKDIEDKVRLRKLEQEKAEREQAEQKQASERAASEKVTQAKTWIKNQIKSDPLASPELDKQLREAGFPSVVDLVFEEMQVGYRHGLTDPKKALDNVRAKLTRQAKALRTAGLVPKGKPPPGKPVSASKPRAGAQTGAAGNGRPMTDAELRQAVLKEAGLWR
jgi:hypothetical protein